MKEIVIVCIGSELVVGDSLGPKVGSLLKEQYNVNSFVYGRRGMTVNASNIGDFRLFINTYHSNATVIAIDACLGGKADIGKIKLTKSGIRAGLAVGRSEESIGAIGVLAIVAERGKDNLNVLSGVSLELVDNMADKVARFIVPLTQK